MINTRTKEEFGQKYATIFTIHGCRFLIIFQIEGFQMKIKKIKRPRSMLNIPIKLRKICKQKHLMKTENFFMEL